MKERIREKQAGECVLAVGRRQVDSQQAHHVWWSREPQKCAQTRTHMNIGDTRAQSALPIPAFNFSQHHQWKRLCKTERIMSVISTKRTSKTLGVIFLKNGRNRTPLRDKMELTCLGEPLLRTPFFIINDFCATERLDYRSIIIT